MDTLQRIDELYIKGHITKEEWQELRKQYEENTNDGLQEPPTVY